MRLNVVGRFKLGKSVGSVLDWQLQCRSECGTQIPQTVATESQTETNMSRLARRLGCLLMSQRGGDNGTKRASTEMNSTSEGDIRDYHILAHFRHLLA